MKSGLVGKWTSRTVAALAVGMLCSTWAHAAAVDLTPPMSLENGRQEISGQVGSDSDQVSADLNVEPAGSMGWSLPECEDLLTESSVVEAPPKKKEKPPIAPLPPAALSGSATLLGGAILRLFRKG